jgi:(S)-2-hydroxyglutarate dehydrogenase
LLLREPSLKVCLLEKEDEPARHQSGRNSGVVHAGYNQKPGTLKARFVVEGSRRLRQFCRERGVPIVEDGILVLARTLEQEKTLDILRGRGEANEAEVRIIGSEELREREPEAYGKSALFAPRGASFDSRSYVAALAGDARDLGAELRFLQKVDTAEEASGVVVVRMGAEKIECRLLINAAGLHADRIARPMGVGIDLKIVPFLGYYSQLRPERCGLVRSHLYPCPDLEFPFLGVHLSRTFDGSVLVGPGSSLALGRESYSPGRIHIGDLLETAGYRGFQKLLAKPRFRQLVRNEWRKAFFRGAVVREAKRIVPALQTSDVIPARAGIRAQLVSTSGDLVDDLVIERTDRSIHVLNAVSPALTCSLPFADHVVNRALESL